jgi:hypothetical protein
MLFRESAFEIAAGRLLIRAGSFQLVAELGNIQLLGGCELPTRLLVTPQQSGGARIGKAPEDVSL